MTEVGGYRTLAQLGFGSPRPLPPGAAQPEPTRFDAVVLPPAHTSIPTHLPNAPTAPPPSELPAMRGVDSLGRPYSLDPRHPMVGIPHSAGPLRPGAPGDDSGVWNVPLTPIALPTPIRMLREGTELIREWHPRDPGVRVSGRHGSASDAPGPEATRPAEPAPPAREGGDDERSDAARIAMMIGIGGGFAQNGIDVARLIKKYPEAIRAGAYDPSLGRLGRLPTALGLTALTRPDNRIIDPTWRGLAASVETGGRTFDRFDELAMKSSVLLGASLAAIQIGSAIPNLADALDNDGPWHENLVMTTSGRAGVLQLAGGTMGAAVFATALRQSAGQAGPGIVSKVLAAGSAPIMARPIWGRIGLGTGAVVVANELGYFDFLNEDEARPTVQVLRESAHRTPVVNDPAWRTAAILGAGGIVGYKAHRAVAAAGGAAGLRAGHLVGGAVVAGLLGAQLLGGLTGLDRPQK